MTISESAFYKEHFDTKHDNLNYAFRFIAKYQNFAS